jgi:hypothetical protein
MINPIEFIKDKLKLIHTQFPNVKLRYENRTYLNLHLVEVLPFETFDSFEHLKLEIQIQEEFEALFGYDEELLFISEGSLNEIRKPIFELGYSYQERVEISKSVEYTFELGTVPNHEILDNTSYALAA